MEVIKSSYFIKWLHKVRSRQARLLVATHIDRMRNGHFGDSRSVGEGVWEHRIHFGAGYRVYYCLEGEQVIVLLLGGDKSSQVKDIAKAKQIKKGQQWKR